MQHWTITRVNPPNLYPVHTLVLHSSVSTAHRLRAQVTIIPQQRPTVPKLWGGQRTTGRADVNGSISEDDSLFQSKFTSKRGRLRCSVQSLMMTRGRLAHRLVAIQVVRTNRTHHLNDPMYKHPSNCPQSTLRMVRTIRSIQETYFHATDKRSFVEAVLL